MLFKAGFFMGLLVLSIISFQRYTGGFYNQDEDTVAEIIAERDKLELASSLEGVKDVFSGVSSFADEYLPSDEEFKKVIIEAEEKGKPILKKIRSGWRVFIERQKKLFM